MSKHGKRHYCPSDWYPTINADYILRKAILPKPAVLCRSLTLWGAKFLTVEREQEGKGSTLWWKGRATAYACSLAKGSCYRCVGGDEVCGKHSLNTRSPASQLLFPPTFSLSWAWLEPSLQPCYAPLHLFSSTLEILSLLHPPADPGAS